MLCDAMSEPDSLTSQLTGIVNRYIQGDTRRPRLSALYPKSSPPKSDALVAALELLPNLWGVSAILSVHVQQAP